MESRGLSRTMRVVAMLSCLSLAAVETHADVPPPPAPKNVAPVVRFVGIEDAADWAFLLAVRTSDRGPGVRKMIEVADGGWFDPGVKGRVHEFTLMAIPRKVYDGLDAEARRRLDPLDPRILKTELPPPVSVGFRWDDPPRCSYVVELRDGCVIVKRSVEQPADARARRGAALHFLGGLALALAAVISGGLYASRMLRKQPD